MLEAVKDKIIVEELKRQKSSGGIIAPTDAIIDPQGYGRVVTVGEDVSAIKVGDVLIFHLQHGGQTIVIKNRILKVLRYEDVYGKLTDKNLISQLTSVELMSQEGTAVVIPQGGILHGVK